MEEMVAQLNLWAYEYYVLDAPTVDDAVYDALYDRLVALEKETGIVLPASPTQRVGGAPLKSFEQHVHLKRLYSLDKVQSFAELQAWVDKVISQVGQTQFTVELKYDGLTINVTYENGRFVSAATRGNGVVGENVTEQVKTIMSVPLEIDYKGKAEFQGEGIMRLSALESYNLKHGENPLKNARNASAGAIRNLDPKVTAERNLDVVFYSVGYENEKTASSQSELVEFLKKNKFKTNFVFEHARSFEEIKAIIEHIASIRNQLDFLIDGAVVKVDDFALREELGYTDKFPKWAVAFKYDAEQVETELINVEWQVGRTGKITPIGILSPVELCGATIKRATLNNYQDVQKKQLQKHAYVFIRRSNDVIPEVLALAGLTDKSSPIEKPTRCPCCNAELREYGANLFCPDSLNCREQIVAKLSHYCSRAACDIEGLSEKTAGILFDNGLVHSFADLYTLTREQLICLDKFKDKKADNLISAIEKSKSVSCDKFIYALGIDNVGSVTAKDLAKRFLSVDGLKNARKEELLAVEQIGETVADGIIEYFADATNCDTVERLKRIGISPVYSEKKYSGVFEGKTVVLTGTLSAYTREQASKIIIERGGSVASSVSKSVTTLLCGIDAGSKLQKAQALNLEIIYEKDFELLIKG